MNESRIYLCAPINAVVEGIYEEHIPLSRIKRHGDFGLGTFDSLDGEMLMLDGTVYQMTADGGRVSVIDNTDLTVPFACVTFYKPLSHDESDKEMTHDAFMEWLQGLLPSPNICYAIRIDGLFSHVKVRSVPKQENYRPLIEVAKDQPVFDFSDIEGTLAGFFTPSFMSSINVPGIHLHFLSKDFLYGGHLLECCPQNVRAGVQFIPTLELSLPISLDYLTWDFQRDIAQDLDKAEK